MFRAMLVAREAGEPALGARRIVAALLQTPSLMNLCARADVDPLKLIHDIDERDALPFEEGVRRVHAELAESGMQLGSREHVASVQPLPLDSRLHEPVRVMLARAEASPVTPLEVLLIVVREDAGIAARFAERGLDTDRIADA